MQKISDSKQIEELKYRNKNILLHFTTEQPIPQFRWCQPCKLSRKLLEAQITQSSNEIVVVEINCDQAQELVLDYKIQGVPTFLLLDKTLKPIQKLIGYLPEKVKTIFKKGKQTSQ